MGPLPHAGMHQGAHRLYCKKGGKGSCHLAMNPKQILVSAKTAKGNLKMLLGLPLPQSTPISDTGQGWLQQVQFTPTLSLTQGTPPSSWFNYQVSVKGLLFCPYIITLDRRCNNIGGLQSPDQFSTEPALWWGYSHAQWEMKLQQGAQASCTGSNKPVGMAYAGINKGHWERDYRSREKTEHHYSCYILPCSDTLFFT